MTSKNFISHSFETEQPNAVSCLAVSVVALFTSVLITTNAQARNMYRFAPIIEVVVYEGDPIDYSNRDDVIVIEESSPQNESSNVLLVQDYTDDYTSQPKAVAYQTSPSAKPQSLRNARPTQQAKAQPTKPKAIPLAVKSMDSIAQNELSQPDKTLIANAEGKDPELVAFYMDVFGKQKNNLSKQPTSSTKLALKQTLAKSVVQNKSKPNKVQLSKKTSKGKDPELVAFYEQVFPNDKSSSLKQVPAVATSKAKDPELVAFYEREFGKSTSRTKAPVLINNAINKIKIAGSSKLDQKRIVKKAKGKTTNSINTAAVELQKLIDDLTSKNII